MNAIPETTIDELISRYDVLLLDAYGVLVTSGGALPGAAGLIDRLGRSAKPYFVLTNDASKLPETAEARYRGYGLHVTADRIVTSGMLLVRYFAEHRLAGARCVVLGPRDSAVYVERAGGRVVAPTEPFDVLVIGDESGYPFLETIDAVLTALIRALDRHATIRLVVPNPDVIYPASDGFGFAGGAVAGMFEAALRTRFPGRTDLTFARLGKPHAPIFEEVVTRAGTRNLVLIGDQLDTDVRGARDFGIDSALVTTGVSGAASAAAPDGLRPTYLLRALD